MKKIVSYKIIVVITAIASVLSTSIAAQNTPTDQTVTISTTSPDELATTSQQQFETIVNTDALIAQAIARVGASKIPEKIDAKLEATLSLAELQEILLKIKEDLNNRVAELGSAADQDTIIKILQQRYNTVVDQIKQLQHFDSEEVNLYLSEKQKNSQFSRLFKILCGATLTTTGAIFLLASYDKETGFNPPDIERLKKNCSTISEWIKNILNAQPSTHPLTQEYRSPAEITPDDKKLKKPTKTPAKKRQNNILKKVRFSDTEKKKGTDDTYEQLNNKHPEEILADVHNNDHADQKDTKALEHTIVEEPQKTMPLDQEEPFQEAPSIIHQDDLLDKQGLIPLKEEQKEIPTQEDEPAAHQLHEKKASQKNGFFNNFFGNISSGFNKLFAIPDDWDTDNSVY